MASYEVEQFANEIDKALTDALIVAKEDYKKRMEAMSGIYNMSDDILRLGRTTRSQLINGAVNEMQRVQREQNSVMEAQIDKVNDKLSSLAGKPEFAKDIVYLSSKLDGWIKKFEELSIPKGSYSNAYSYSAGTMMKNIQSKWEDFCATDPSIKKAELYEKKTKIEEDIASYKNTITDLEKKLPELCNELEDRCSNTEKYETRVKSEFTSEIEAIETELRHANEDMSDLETQEKSVQSELNSTGIFAFGKKKELRAKLDLLAHKIQDTKSTISSIEERKKAKQDSLPRRIAELSDRIVFLKKEIEDSETILRNSETKLEDSVSELKRVVNAIEE